jgi:signal transduction histidine kinase
MSLNPLFYFDHLRLWQKFTCLGLLCLTLIALPSLLYTTEVRKQIIFSNHELQGLAPAQLMLNIIQYTQQHRGLSTRYLADINPINSERNNAERAAKSQQLNAAIAELVRHTGIVSNPHLFAPIKLYMDYWSSFESKIPHKDIDTDESIQLHTALIRMQLDCLQIIVDEYQLSLDPSENSYFLILASLNNLPETTEVLGQIRALSVRTLAHKSISNAERTQLEALLLISKNKIKELEINITKAAANNTQLPSHIFENYHATQAQYQKIIALTQDEILSKSEFTYSIDDFYAAFTLAINSYFSYEHFSLNEIGNILQDRIQQQTQKMYALLSYLAIITLLVSFFCIRFAINLLLQLGGEPSYATAVVKAIIRGDLQQNIVTHNKHSLLSNMKIMQEKLKQNEQLKNEFVATISHELRTPLTAIKGALSISISGKMGRLPAPVEKLLSIAHNNTQRLSELINDLLDIDKLTAGKLEISLVEQPLAPIIEEAVHEMTAYAEKYNVKLSVNTHNCLAHANIDKRRTLQVLVNFISNACKFSHPNETVTINLSQNEHSLRIDVIDHGSGIPEAFQAYIFQKFSQADSSSTRALGGAGLGLAISKALVDRMGGNIGFNSSPGVGSCFYCAFPIVKTDVKNPLN